MEFRNLLLETSEGIATVTVNRPAGTASKSKVPPSLVCPT